MSNQLGGSGLTGHDSPPSSRRKRPQLKKWLSGGIAASVVAMSLSLISAPAANAVVATVPPAANPALPDTCEMDFAMSLDLSNSVENDQLVAMRSGVVQLAEDLADSGMPIRLSLHNFASNAPATGSNSNAPLPLTELDEAGVQAVTDWVNGMQRPASQQGGTNWDRAFNAVTTNPEIGEYDALLFVTDGNPTQYSSPAQGPGNSTDLATINAAVNSANALKATGTRVIGVGVTDNISSMDEFREHMAQISGPVFGDGSSQYPVNSDVDYVDTSFDDIAAMLLSIIEVNCAAPAMELDKESNPAPGTEVLPGQTIEYTVAAPNTGNTVLDPAEVSDDLSGVLDFATFNDDIVTEINGQAVPSGGAALSGDELAWVGLLEPGDVLTITYSVTVNEGVAGELVKNLVTASGTPPTGPPVTPPPAETEHPVPAPGFEVAKSADPADGTEVHPGDTITYTVTGSNTGETALNPVTLTDDLSAVLNNAEYNGDAVALIDGAPAGDVALDGTNLIWTGSLAAGESVTLTYSVTVNEDAAGSVLNNVVTGEATPPGQPPIVPPSEETEHPVPEPGFEVAKSADPADGTAVNPGDVITYSVTGANTGETVLNPVTLTDDLSAVLNNAEYNGDAVVTINGEPAGDVVVDGNQLSWTGALQVGETVTITYSVTVNEDAEGAVLNNVVSGEATPPGQPPLTPPSEETEHPVPGFEVGKSADPASGSEVHPGDVITYSVTGSNKGATVLDPVTLTDNLAGVLGNAEYNGDAVVTINGESAGDVVVDGTQLSWTGALQVGETVTITYSVTVGEDAEGAVLNNVVSGEATPPGQPPLTPPSEETEHPVPTPGFDVLKSAEPVSGTAVDPGETITYTVSGVNTGETELSPVVITDDLSDVLAHAEYNGDAVATINGESAGELVLEGTTLVWTGSLEIGETVTITYSVTVDGDVAGEVLHNTVEGEATPPGGGTLTPPPSETDHPVNVPGFSTWKSADPETGTAVDPGETITYTVTGENTGETALDPVVITDDMAEVLTHADYNDDAVATINGESAGEVVVEGTELVWTGSLAVGESVTITYSVTVHADAGGETIRNVVDGTATPPGGHPPIETPPSETEHPVNEPGFEVEKTADPASGTAVDPGETITYTVTGINTGETALDPVVITDDLAGALAHADFNDDVIATIDGESAGDLVVNNDELVWTGALAVGESVTITYSVTVHADAGGETIRNIVEGEATPPGGNTLVPPPSETEHPVKESGFEFSKNADPASGTTVETGSVMNYTLTGVNTGETVLNPVAITDSLDEVLAHADYNGDAVAMIDGAEAEKPVVNGNTLTWTGVLEPGQTVTITYSVTVHDDAHGETLRNVAVGTATPPGGETLTPPPGSTEHPIAKELPRTGAELAPWLGAGLLLMLFGGALLVLIRRQRI